MKARPSFVVVGLLLALILLMVRSTFLETVPPEVTIEGIGEVVRAGASATIRAVEDDLGIGQMVVLLDGEIAQVDGGEGPWTFTLPDALEDGQHTLVVIARDRSWNRNEGRARVAFRSDSTAPRLRLAPSTRAAQGRVLPIVLGADEPLASVEATAFDRPLPLVERDGLWVGVTGAGVSQEDGELVAVVTDVLGNTAERRLPLPVATTTFAGGGVVTLDAKRQANQKDGGLRAQDRERRREAYATPQETWLVDGPAVPAVEGVISSPFGKRRTYNTGIVRHHLGTDIAAPQGRPVHASAAGVVALAEALPIHGNAVVLRHGPSLSTSYNHLHTIDVEVGQTVQQGEVVGTVGSTGQSTGPHLHWGLVAGGVAVAAEGWLERDLLAVSPEDRAALEAPWNEP